MFHHHHRSGEWHFLGSIEANDDLFEVEFKDGASATVAKASGLTWVDAYTKLRNTMGLEGKMCLMTNTEIGDIIGAMDGDIVFNTTTKKIETYFKFEISSTKQIHELTKIISIDNIKNKTVYAYDKKKEFDKFLSLNIDYTILTSPGELIKNP